MKKSTPTRKKENPKAYRKERYLVEKEKTKRVNLTLNLREYERLKSESERSQTKPTAYAKTALMATIDKRMKQSLPAPATITMLVQTLRPIATNFNQLVRRANTYGANAAKLDQATQSLHKIQHTIDTALHNPTTIEKQIIAYLYRDPNALFEIESILQNFKSETGK